jgi:tRNA 2-thiouridine synthesizing protein A
MTLHVDQDLDLSGLSKVLRIVATDPASERDFRAFSEQSGIPLLQVAREGQNYIYWLQKP